MLDMLNPNEIESIEVIKSQAAEATVVRPIPSNTPGNRGSLLKAEVLLPPDDIS